MHAIKVFITHYYKRHAINRREIDAINGYFGVSSFPRRKENEEEEKPRRRERRRKRNEKENIEKNDIVRIDKNVLMMKVKVMVMENKKMEMLKVEKKM